MASLEQVTKEIFVGLDFVSNSFIREVALDYNTESKKRIFTDGKKADGKQIGWYKASTIAIKRKKGRFTSDSVNLRDTETLVNSYLAQPRGKDYDVGFVSGSNSGITNTEKVKKLKKKYGDDLFDATEDEIEKAIENAEKLINF